MVVLPSTGVGMVILHIQQNATLNISQMQSEFDSLLDFQGRVVHSEDLLLLQQGASTDHKPTHDYNPA
jgi:hypothetical protein